MAKLPFVNVPFAWNGRRLSFDSNSLDVQPMREELEASTFEDKVDKVELGLHKGTINVKGFSSIDLERDHLLPRVVDAGSHPFTLPQSDGGAAGGPCVLTLAKLKGVPFTREHGQLVQFEAPLIMDDRFDDGFVMFQSYGTAGVTAATTGPVVNVGALLATQELILDVHVLYPPGVTGTTPTLGGKLKSSAVVGFTSPTDRVTLDSMDDTWRSKRYTLAGPVTDAYWRLDLDNPGGTDTPKFFILAAAAIRTL